MTRLRHEEPAISPTLTLDTALALPVWVDRIMAVRNSLTLHAGEGVLEARPGYLKLRILNPSRLRRLKASLTAGDWTVKTDHDDTSHVWTLEAHQ